MLGFGAGLVFPRAPIPAEAPGLKPTLQWMFDAALTYDGTTEAGEPVPAVIDAIVVEDVRVAESSTEPMLVIVSDSTGFAAYELSVTRHALDWTVTAHRLTDRASPEN